MNKETKRKKQFLFFIGIFILALGITLFIKSNTGSDPFTTFNLGISHLLNKMFALVQVGINTLILIVILIVDKSYIKIGTIISMMMVGPLIEINLVLLEWVGSMIPLAIPSYVLLPIGCLLVCLGAGIYIAADQGAGPYDIIPILFEEKFNYSFKLTRIVFDLICVILGGVLGATIGMGTLITAIFLGPGIAYFRKLTQVYVLKETM